MNLFVEIFYALGTFFILYTMYELLNYKGTKKILDMTKESIMYETPLGKEYGFKFLVDLLVFTWSIISIIISIFNDMWLIFGFSIGIILLGLIQMIVIIKLSTNDKNIVVAYYITTTLFLGLLSIMLLYINPLDIL